MSYMNFVKSLKYIQSKPLLRGMVMYSITWPVSSLIQQSFENEKYKISRVVKFSLYGAFYAAPSFYGWMKLSSLIWPQSTFKHAVIKSLIEQVSYGPFAMCSFFFIMTILDGGTTEDGLKEISDKFFPTWKIAVFISPCLQTFNYTLIPERNRVPFRGLCSLGWTVFLAFVKYQRKDPMEKEHQS